MTLQIADLRFSWTPRGPLLSSYDYRFSRESGMIQPGERKVSQYESRNDKHALTPSLLATSTKGVFRGAAAWLIERTGHQFYARDKKAPLYITCDYANAIPQEGGWKEEAKALAKRETLCPVCRVFGGSGCLGDESSNVLRRQGIVRFHFDGEDDALFGKKKQRSKQFFAWEVASQKSDRKPLVSEELVVADAHLGLQIRSEVNEDLQLAVALLGLSADLISSGFFRFGRFTSRGYGWVQLGQPEGRLVDLLALLGQDSIKLTSYQSGRDLAMQLLKADPLEVIESGVKEWIHAKA